MKRRQQKSTLQSPLTAVALQDHMVRELGLVSRAKPPKPVKPVHSGSVNMEYTLDPEVPPLTLAQKLGLVGAPPPQLTLNQWSKVKEISNKRGDSTHPCPICHDEFGTREQVILSCTHTFHKRYSGKKQCPLCRCPTYQTRLIHTAANLHKDKAATRIQATWRGYVVRQWLANYRQTHPPVHPILRQQHYVNKLSSITNQLVQTCTDTTDSIDSFLNTIDSELAESRKTMSLFSSCKNELTSLDWININRKARQYLTTDCAICLCSLSLPRPLTVLSCSHLYHTPCLNSLEMFTCDAMPHLCPICRTPYQSTEYKM